MNTIGIDLGNSNLCFALWKNGNVEILENDFYKTITPMFLSYKKDNNVLFGEKAKENAIRNMNDTIFDIKRIFIKDKFKEYPFLNSDGSIKIMKNNNKIDLKTVFKDLFTQIKNVIYKKYNIDSAIISLPHFMNKNDLNKIEEAGKEVNFKIKSFINDKLAITLTYQLNNNFKLNETDLIIDIGGSKTELSIINIKNYELKVISSFTEKLGGRDFDKKLLEFMTIEMSKQENIQIKGKLQRNLELECEKTKITLSSGNVLNLEYNYIYEDEDRSATYELERKVLEKLCTDLYKKFEDLLKKFFTINKKEEITQVILIGGTTRMPKIQEIISNFFGKNKINLTLNPDEAVARGAAIYAAMNSNINDVSIDIDNLKQSSLDYIRKYVSNSDMDDNTLERCPSMKDIIKKRNERLNNEASRDSIQLRNSAYKRNKNFKHDSNCC